MTLELVATSHNNLYPCSKVTSSTLVLSTLNLFAFIGDYSPLSSSTLILSTLNISVFIRDFSPLSSSTLIHSTLNLSVFIRGYQPLSSSTLFMSFSIRDYIPLLSSTPILSALNPNLFSSEIVDPSLALLSSFIFSTSLFSSEAYHPCCLALLSSSLLLIFLF